MTPYNVLVTLPTLAVCLHLARMLVFCSAKLSDYRRQTTFLANKMVARSGPAMRLVNVCASVGKQ